jgi:hypothetical protein
MATRTVRRAGLLVTAVALLAGAVATPAAQAAPAPTQQVGLAADACGGVTAVDLSSFPDLGDDHVRVTQRAGVIQDQRLIRIVLVAGSGINANKAIRACNGGQVIDEIVVTSAGDSDSMILELADVEQLTLRKKNVFWNNKYGLTNSDIDHLGGYELKFSWVLD